MQFAIKAASEASISSLRFIIIRPIRPFFNKVGKKAAGLSLTLHLKSILANSLTIGTSTSK